MKRSLRLLVELAVLLVAGPYSSAQSSPSVEFDSQNAGPRSVEDLTSQTVPRDYAFAWQNLAQALDENRPGLLDAYFTGFAKSSLEQRIKQQAHAGLHVRYTDHGHKLNVLFYSPNGDLMQIEDDAQLEMQILDGSKVIQTQPLHVRYMVLMTPGADRWMVRDLESTPAPRSGE
ncbi:MAG: hypothetical protein ACRD4I_11850 [Candidatus Angelobacter sp.]